MKFINITPAQSKKLGKQVKIRDDWELVKDQIMHDIVREKFMQNIDLDFAMQMANSEASAANAQQMWTGIGNLFPGAVKAYQAGKDLDSDTDNTEVAKVSTSVDELKDNYDYVQTGRGTINS